MFSAPVAIAFVSVQQSIFFIAYYNYYNGELGRVSLSISRKVQAVKYWHRLIKENEKLPIYLREAYFLAKSDKLKWYLNISDIFKSFRLDHPNKRLTINDIKNHFVNILYTNGKFNCNHQLEN